MRTNIYTYRSVSPDYHIIEREYEVFEEPESITENNRTYHRVPNQATKGWVLVEYREENGDDFFSEYWKINEAPESIVRDGKTYIKQIGVPLGCDPFRMGSGLLNKCDKGFQEVMRHAEKKSGQKWK